jgi:hypothetical protein
MSNSQDHTLGDVLVRMGVLTPVQLEDALRFQREATEDTILGRILITSKMCTSDQVETAIEAQKGLRSGRLSDQALAAARVAGQRKKVMRNANLDLIHQGAKALKRVRGDEFTPIMGIMLPTVGSKR